MLNSILLVDDNNATNYIHEKNLVKANCAKEIKAFQVGQLALDYLDDTSNALPDIIFVDINMPTMDAWEFIEEYKLIKRANKDKVKIFLLTTSLIPKDEAKINTLDKVVSAVIMKPLTTASIQDILAENY